MTTEPPVAKQVPSQRTFHGDTVTDEYAWLTDKANPETLEYLRAENAYTEAATAGLAALRDQIFGEIKARTQESDLSVPVRKGDWWHYSRTVEGRQYHPTTPGGKDSIFASFLFLTIHHAFIASRQVYGRSTVAPQVRTIVAP